jgi:predicted SnoaL-like aldol condensation-catalyzing enzyme
MGTLSQLVAEYIERVVNRRDVTAVDDTVAPDYVGSGHGWPATREALRSFYETQAHTRPDWHIDIKETVEVGDSVVVRAHAGGTVTEDDHAERQRVEWLTHYRIREAQIIEINVLTVVRHE